MFEEKKSYHPLILLLILSTCFFLFFILISGVLFFKKSSALGSKNNFFFSKESIGVIELEGVILDSKKTLARLERFEEDDRIKAVVMRLNSPGGAVAPSQEIYQAVQNYKKPLIVSMGSVAASGAYYIACGAKKIYANPGTITGSIGVIMEFANLQELYHWAKIERYTVKSGKFKDSGSEYRSMTAEERTVFQKMIDDVLDQFKAAVVKGRNLSMTQVNRLADGRIFSGNQAYQAHLVDELGTIKDAINEAAQIANIKGKPNIIYPEGPKRKWIDYLLNDSSDAESRSASPFFKEKLGAFFLSLFKNKDALINDSSFPHTKIPGIYWLWSLDN